MRRGELRGDRRADHEVTAAVIWTRNSPRSEDQEKKKKKKKKKSTEFDELSIGVLSRSHRGYIYIIRKLLTGRAEMDRGGCQMNGGGGGGGGDEPEQTGMITLEDLESFSEDHMSDSGNSLDEDAKSMEDDDRLLHYWQDVARGHQVEVSQEMAEPIQQLTSNNQGRSNRELIPFTLLARKEKCGELLWEKRQYEKGHWACVTMREDTYEKSICYGFMKLMRYICQQNSSGNYLGMTLPIVTVVRTDENHSVISNDVTVAYFLPTEHQAQPPRPNDNDIAIEIWPANTVYTRPFTGPTNEVTIVNQINAMAEQLDPPGANDSFIVAGYTNPAHVNRQNEIWFLERP